MIARPCRTCGTPTPTGSYCADCQPPDAKATAHQRGYDSTWRRLSTRARQLQPFCTDCGATADLQADHSPEAWQRKAQGLSIRLRDIDVVCGPCNRDRGAARPGRGPITAGQRPEGKAQSALLLTTIPINGGGGSS